MTYRLPLSKRQHMAAYKRWRYRVDPEYRLSCINRGRAKRGEPQITDLSGFDSLAEIPDPRSPVRRDKLGRFV